MNTLSVARMASLPSAACDVPQLLDELNVSFSPIAIANWPAEYPYTPKAEFRLAWCPEGLAINYRVTEQSVRGHYGEDAGQVWTDSCVECFIRNADNDTYFNIECNCIGTLLMAMGDSRHDRKPVDPALLAKADRWASLGRTPFEERQEETSWEVALVIPAELFQSHPIKLEGGNTLRANFYKCGDELQVPHFLSWNAIEVATPDFHRPEFFGELALEN